MRPSRFQPALGHAAEGASAPVAAPPTKLFGRGGRLFTYRNALGVGVGAFLLLFPWGRVEPSVWCFASGLVLTLAGSALRLWSILQIGGAARKTSKLKAVRVISWGPFAMVRNPIYIANITVFAGFTVLSRLLWAVPFVVVGLGLWYNAVVRREEAFLEDSFGNAFREYKGTTRRWLPALRFRRRPADVSRYPFLRAVRRERGHLLIVAAGIVSFLLLPVFSEKIVHQFANPSTSGSTNAQPAASP